MYKWETVADRKIREAMEAGEFDNLPSKGRPIPLDLEPFEDPSLWMAHHLLQVNGFAPPWIDESRQIDEECARLHAEIAAARAQGRPLQILRDRAAEMNRRILTYNLKSPGTRFHKRPVDWKIS